MSEMAVTADHLIVIGRGQIIADGPVDDGHRPGHQGDRARALPAGRPTWPPRLAGPDVDGDARRGPGLLEVIGATTEQVGEIAAAAGIVAARAHAAAAGRSRRPTCRLTSEDSVEYHSAALPGEESGTAGATPPPAATTAEDAR